MQGLFNSLQLSDYVQMLSAFLGAFFAFCFFVFGQFCISSSKEKNNNITNLERMREYVVMQIYFFESNIQKHKNIIDNIAPIGVSVNELSLFPIEEGVYQRIGGFKVVKSIMKFIVHLRVLNENIRVFNKWLNELSEFSRIAMLEQREHDFSKTMSENVERFKKEAEKIYNHMTFTKETIDHLLAEIDFTEKYVRAFFWTKWYISLKIYFDSAYRDKQIEKIMKQ